MSLDNNHHDAFMQSVMPIIDHVAQRPFTKGGNLFCLECFQYLSALDDYITSFVDPSVG